MSLENKSPAETASEQALAEVYECLKEKRSFLLEAGAGAGKTYSLIKALRFLIERDEFKLPRNHQKIACITFTNVAKNEIEARTDRNPLIYCETTHAFCWSLISGFQKQLRELVPTMKHWPEKFEEAGPIEMRTVEYSLGFRSIKDSRVSIHHDDVLPLMISLMANEKFRRIITDKYPIILIDEYQDTNADWIEAIKTWFLGQQNTPQFGFFGDHWQKIYGDGCGRIDHDSLTLIGKKANFRSVPTIVNCLNKIRPELQQMVENPDGTGSVEVFHTNNWTGARETRNHWQGDLPSGVSHIALNNVISRLKETGWDLSEKHTKILMLTHRVLANEQGYVSLLDVFKYNESFVKKENEFIAYFVDKLEPACTAYSDHKYGQMFAAFGGSIPAIQSHSDKVKWTNAMDALLNLRIVGTVGQVVDHLRATRHPHLPDALEKWQRELDSFDKNVDAEMTRPLAEYEKLRAVSYKEIISLAAYLTGYSPFETKHGVKGAEFENVIVVLGRGWNQYNFNNMLEQAQNPANILKTNLDAYVRNRNLFYVACSRPKRRLALLFTQEVSNQALLTLRSWFGENSIVALNV
jgi:DNA helicase-2/ATP-dependent DNA helicase PcrA